MLLGITDSKYYSEIANAIREKKEVSTPYTPQEMAEAILSIETEGNTSNEPSCDDTTITIGAHHYKPVSIMIPGKTYLITDEPIITSNLSVLKCEDNLELSTAKVAVDSDSGTILKFNDDINCEWTCMPGNLGGTNTEYSTPATFMFQNRKTGKWLYNPVYEESNGSNMSVISDPLNDDYSPFSRQIFCSDKAFYSYFQSKNQEGYAQYNTSEPSWIKIGTNTYSSSDSTLSDPYITFNLAGQKNFNDLVLTYYTANTNGGVFEVFVRADNDYIDINLGSGLTPEWRSFVLSDNTTLPISNKLLRQFRFDLNKTDAYSYLSSAILFRNIYARISGQAYARTQAKYGPRLVYPSHRYPFCQFATPLIEDSKIIKVSNFDSSGITLGYPEQYSYGWRNGKFVRSWNNANISAFQLWERVDDEEEKSYEYVLVTDEKEIINGETYIIGDNENFEDATLWYAGTQDISTTNYIYSETNWEIHKIGEYFYLTSSQVGKNLSYNKNETLGYVNGAVGENGVYFRWKYDFINHRLIGYTNPQSAGEGLQSVKVGFNNETEHLYLFRRKLRDPAQYNWDSLFSAIDNGTYRSKYRVGDTIPLDLGEEGLVNMEIVAFDADELADNSGYAPVTLISKELLMTSHRMNQSLSNNEEGTGAIGGWEKTELRAYLKNNIKPLILEGVRNRIADVIKYSTSYNTDLEQISDYETVDDVWIPSYRETGHGTTYKETQGPSYSKIFTNVAVSREKVWLYNSSMGHWHLRTANSPQKFYGIAHDGFNFIADSSMSSEIALGFCIH